MFNEPMLMMSPFKSVPLACFSLRTPWLYNDEDYCGDPHSEGHTNGSGAPGPCGGAFFLELLDENGSTVAKLKNQERYEADPYEMYEGTWGDFYESARTFTEPMVLAEGISSEALIRSIKFNLLFGDFELSTSPTRILSIYGDRYQVGSFKVAVETSSELISLVSNGEGRFIYSYIYTGLPAVTYRDSSLSDQIEDIFISIPETLSLRYLDIQKIHISVTAGTVAWCGPPTGEIV